ncbi:NAD(P)-dependent oxidoreductase [Crossiella cryophila]|uniref:3-hydroxyisobutyrate dehydrogenase-like beta-hydroxyacid dehydrogenase n=1 Tax=Crossiella cryophila TaxID=43355 RepID=A0A7W7FSJ4_9PSEU|nr:NAD(P)-dependent oxidoreductase [Crossiella cryophila]MBB4676010.1 3-hydroxyisobutyrate dehydrogenase-like beta-hydroxyacid dehydrogenase [Crossiella cryophila]
MVAVVGTGARAVGLAGVLGEAGGAGLVVVCAEGHGELAELLAPELGGVDLVNLTSGTGAEARAAAELVRARGGRYLDGALMAHPEHLGRPETVLVYSGDAAVFRRQRAVLARLGEANYLGPDPGTAALYDLALLNFAWATLIGYLQTAALLGADGVPAAAVTPMLTRWLRGTVAEVIEDYATQLDAGSYPGEQEWLELDAPLMGNLVLASAERGLDLGLPRLVESLTARGIAAGFGRDGFASLVEVIRGSAAAPART